MDMSTNTIKSSHKAIQKYHETLLSFRQQEVEHEGATRFAFQTLLHETCRTHGWVLIPEERTKVGGKTVIPDGTLRDLFNLHRGFAYYNFCWKHGTLKETPAMAAGLTDHRWTVEELVSAR
jgi:hypothetical protein